MIEDEVEYLDDPIRLFDFERTRVFCCPEVADINIGDLGSSFDGASKGRTEYEETLYTYKSNSSILSIAFFDIDRNVELLKQCRPLSVRIIDCRRFPRHKRNEESARCNDTGTIKNHLRKANCKEVLSSVKMGSHETFSLKSPSKSRANINEDIGKIKFASESDVTPEKQAEMEISKKEEGYDCGEIKKNKGMKVSQTDIVVDRNSDMRKSNLSSYSESDKEADAYEVDTYARIINKAYQNIRNLVKSPNNVTHLKTCNAGAYCAEDENINKSKQHRNKIPENRRNSENRRDNNDNSDIQILGKKEVKNNPPISVCPPKQGDDLRNIKLIPETSYPSNTRYNIKSNDVCKNKLFSANRVIPHYHNRTIHKVKKNKPPSVCQNISKDSTARKELVQTSIECVTCKAHGLDYTNHRARTRECDINKRPRLAEANVKLNNMSHNNHFLSDANRVHSQDCVLPNFYRHQSPQCNLDREPVKYKIKLHKKKSDSKMSRDSVSSPDATKRSKCNLVSIVNHVPGLLGQKPQKNGTLQLVPIQRAISNPCCIHPTNLYTTAQPNGMPSLSSDAQKILPTNTHPYCVGDNLYMSQNDILKRSHNLETPEMLFEYGTLTPSFYTIPLRPLTAINFLP